MVYQLKKDNYKSFNIFKDNVLEPRAYFIPFASKQELDETDIRTERYNSSMVSVLSGEWDFKYYSKRSEMPDAVSAEDVKPAEPDNAVKSADYIGNSNSHIFHKPSCGSANTIKEENRVSFKSREDAVKSGYTPCKRCNP